MLRRLLSRLLRPHAQLDYSALLADPPALQAALLEDIAAGRLTFYKRVGGSPIHTERNWCAREAPVRLEIDYPGMGGSFTYLWVHGRDVTEGEFRGRRNPSTGALEGGLDVQRLIGAVRTGTDPGPQPENRSLYWM